MEFTRYEKSGSGPLVDAKGRVYSEADNGFIHFGDVANHLMEGDQTQYASRYVQGSTPGYPNLGNGLRFNGDVRDYHSLGIHPEDIEEFVHRVYAYRAYKHGYVTDDQGNYYQLEEADKEQLREHLEIVRAFDTEWAKREPFGM